MRICFQDINNKEININKITKQFRNINIKYKMKSKFYNLSKKSKIIIMVSKFGHCLNNILFQWKSGMLNLEIAIVVSNHQNMSSLVQSYGIDYKYLPINIRNKKSQEKKLLEIIKKHNINLVVLARYMQVLSTEICNKMKGKIINIHHSFLPSFKGAKPYQQAYKKGVKLIGATAHYVTKYLDEGQIIEQDVARVNHSYSLENFTTIGRDIESLVLSRALKWHTEHRVLINENRTVVFY